MSAYTLAPNVKNQVASSRPGLTSLVPHCVLDMDRFPSDIQNAMLALLQTLSEHDREKQK